MAGEKRPLNIVCIGAGYVGGPTMTVIAQQCPHINVTVFDISAPRIAAWNSPAPKLPGEASGLPIYEPGIADAVYKVRGRNLFFTTDVTVLKSADIVFVSVNTPTKRYGIGAGRAADLMYLEGCVRMIAEQAENRHVVVVEKSTVPVRCSIMLQRVLMSLKKESTTFSVLSNPEFLAEGTALQDLLSPDRVLIGGEDEDAVALLSSVYENWVPKERIVTTNLWTSELSKLVANAFLAQRISSINSITPLCERAGADVLQLRTAIATDRRIGPNFLCPSIGFGGSCFQKDILSLVYICESLDLPEVAAYWDQVIKINNYQKERFYRIVVQGCFDTVRGKKLAVLGFAFKKNTSDTRESAAIYLCSHLLVEGATLEVYDPRVSEEAMYMELENFIVSEHLDVGLSPLARDSKGTGDTLDAFLRSRVRMVRSAEEAAGDAAALLVLTEWDEFRSVDYSAVYEKMQKPAMVFDGRLILDVKMMERIGFNVFSIGKPVVNPFFCGNRLQLTDFDSMCGSPRKPEDERA